MGILPMSRAVSDLECNLLRDNKPKYVIICHDGRGEHIVFSCRHLSRAVVLFGRLKQSHPGVRYSLVFKS